MQLALAATGAAIACFCPGLGRFEIGVPKGPSLALAGTRTVDIAFAGLAVEEHAVPIVVFGETLADANFTDVPPLKLRDLKLGLSGHRSDVCLV